MYPVTELFQEKIKENTREFKLQIEIQHSSGTLYLTDKDIIGGTVVYTEGSQPGEDFTVGGTVASTFNFDLIRKEEYADIEFDGATVIPQIGLLLNAIEPENYFLAAPQPSEFEDNAETEQWEYVPLGRFNIDEADKLRSVIKIKSIDNMIELDKPYSLSSLGYPATLYQIYMNICTVADVQPATTSFTNQGYVVQERPEGDLTLRDMLSYVAELAGCFARFNRTGALELTWYSSSGLTLTGANRFNFKPREELINIRGVAVTVKVDGEETMYLAGTDDYYVDLSDNPLLQDDYSTIISNIYNKVKDTIFTPYESSWQGNPAIQAGDIITQVDRDGIPHTTLVTHSTYKYRGGSTLAARGLPIKAKGYKGSSNKKIAQIKRKIEKEMGDKLTALEQAQLNVTELIANMLGGYTFYEADAFYIADNPVLADAVKVWKWGIGGFGYSENGVAGPYTTAITADGTIVAMLVAANIITADMIEAGIMTSKTGKMVIDLDNELIKVFNNSSQLKVALGKYAANKYGIQIKDANNNRTLLDESGLLNSWQQNMADNFDSNHSAKLKFYLPPNAGDRVNLSLSFSLEKFRSYVDTVGHYTSFKQTDEVPGYILDRAVSTNGEHSHSSLGWTGAAGNHNHTINLQHRHGIDLSHTHPLKHAVFEGTAPSNVGIKIDGVDRTSVLGGPWNGEVQISDLSIKPYISANGWHTIEFFMPENVENPVIGRVVANLFGMIFMYAPS